MPLKVVIAEDNDLMRASLRCIVEGLDYVEIIGEANDGATALSMARQLRPNVIFLDIGMPLMDGIDVGRLISDHNLRQINVKERTHVIFVTAYEQRVFDAYDLYASDFIIKPFRHERITKTMDRIYSIYKTAQDHSSCKLIIETEGDIVFIEESEIIFVNKEGKQTVIHTVNGNIATNETLDLIENKLSCFGGYLRCHRGYIINTMRVVRLEPMCKKSYTVYLSGTTETAIMTKDKKVELLDRRGISVDTYSDLIVVQRCAKDVII